MEVSGEPLKNYWDDGKIIKIDRETFDGEQVYSAKEAPVMEVSREPLKNERKYDSKNYWDDGEFIKVDRETFEGEQVTSTEEGKTYVGQSSREPLEERDKTKELEIELERTAIALKTSESQNAKLKDKISMKEEILKGNGKKYKELELDCKNLQEKMTQAEKNFNQKLNAYDNLNLEYESSKKKIEELEGVLESQAAQFTDMVKSCHSKIEGADKRVSEVESLLEAKKKIIEELAGHLSTLESKSVHGESESKKYSAIVSELTEELKKSQSSILSLETALKIATQKEAQSLSENELLVVTNSQLKNKIDELQKLLNFVNSEKEATSLQLASHMNAITELTDQHSRSIEISHTATETHRLKTEGQVKEVTNKLADKEREVKELNKQVVALESQVKRYQVEAGESAEIAEFRKLEVQEILGNLSEQKDQVKKLNNMHISLESQVKIYEEEKRHTSELAESRKVEIDNITAKLHHKDIEVKNLNEKINALEIQLKTFQDEASKVSGISESRRLEIENTILKLQDHSKIVEELQFELSQVETRNEALAEANMKLTQDLALAETEQSDLYAKLSRAGDDKDDLTAQYELSKKIIEDLTEELRFEKERRQSEKATVPGSSQVHEAKKELQAIINNLEGQLEEYKRNEDTQKADLEKLKSDITEKSAFLKELEERYQTAEARLKDEVKSVERSAIAREGDLTSQLEHHVRKLNDRDLLDERVVHLEQELQLAQDTISKLVSELEAARSQASDNLEAENTNVSHLLKKVEELEQKLKVAEAIPEQKSNVGIQEVETEVKSRDIGSMFSNRVKIKRNTAEEPSAHTTTPSSLLTGARTSEASTAMNFKLILGVALMSIIIGVILGKRY